VKNALVLIVGLITATAGYCADSEAERNAKQAELDSKCEEARQKALAPIRQDIFDECLEKKEDELVCKNEAAEYNGAKVGRGPLFYDLPECVVAFDNKKDK
jgi:hypothetical protein